MTARTSSSVSGARPFATEMIADPIFLIPPSYDSGGKFARNIEIGDFNGDSKADLVISNQCVSDTDCTQGTIAVLLGNGDGTYQPARLSNTGAILSTIAVGDFNRDGNLDVAVDNSCPDPGCTTGSVNILLGKGDGTFQPPVAYPSGGNAFSVEAGDINGDGKLDLVVVNGSGSAGVLLGNGDGKFMPVSTVATSTSGNSAVFLSDFNNDAKLDLAVVTGNCDSTGTCTRSINVLLGNGNGTFGMPVGHQSTVGLNPQAVAVGDVNGDGRVDLAVIDACVPTTITCAGEFADVFLGNGDGTFSAAKSSALSSTDVTFVGLGDLNTDGKSDLVTVDPNAASATVMLGIGDGTFQLATSYETNGNSPLFGILGDLNGDGKPDFAVANACQVNFQDTCTGNALPFLGIGNGTLAGPTGYPVAQGSNVQSIATADFNGDGKPDLAEVTLNLGSSSFPSASVKILLGQADGTFVPGPTSPVSATAINSPSGLPFVVGDFNYDNKSDLAAITCLDQDCTKSGIAVLLGRGDGTFNSPLFSAPLSAVALTVGDFNGDGNLDLAAVTNTCANADDVSCNDGFVNILLGNGDGTLQAPVRYPFVGARSTPIAAGDVNLDGKMDLVVSNNNCGEFDCPMGSLSVLLGNGDGTFQTGTNYSAGNFGSSSVVIADFNADGKPDLVVSNLGPCVSIPCGEDSLGLLLGNGDGTFQSAAIISGGTTGDPIMVAAADLDGDGKLDLALSNREVLSGNGDGTFKDAQNYNPAFISGFSELVADFNSDGKADLVINTRQSVIVLLNISAGFLQSTSTALRSSRNPADVHRRVEFTATVASTSPTATAGKTPVGARPCGTVTFSDAGHALSTVNIVNGRARFSTSMLDAGIHPIRAIYSGDQTFLTSTSPQLNQVVRAATRTKLSSSQNPSQPQQPVTFTATVMANSGDTPTGTVTFRDFGTVLGTVELNGGEAGLTAARLRKGLNAIRAEYNGSIADQRSFSFVTESEMNRQVRG